MITVRLPPSLRTTADDLLPLAEDVRSIADLIDAIDRRIPGFRKLFDEGGCNFAVNDEIVLHRVRDVVLKSGDVVEIVPTISGGSRGGPSPSTPLRAGKLGPYGHLDLAKLPSASGRLKKYADRKGR